MDLQRGYWICGKEGGPMYCWFVTGDADSCMDSTHLWGPFGSDEEAEAARLEPSVTKWLADA